MASPQSVGDPRANYNELQGPYLYVVPLIRGPYALLAEASAEGTGHQTKLYEDMRRVENIQETKSPPTYLGHCLGSRQVPSSCNWSAIVTMQSGKVAYINVFPRTLRPSTSLRFRVNFKVIFTLVGLTAGSRGGRYACRVVCSWEVCKVRIVFSLLHDGISH